MRRVSPERRGSCGIDEVDPGGRDLGGRDLGGREGEAGARGRRSGGGGADRQPRPHGMYSARSATGAGRLLFRGRPPGDPSPSNYTHVEDGDTEDHGRPAGHDLERLL